MRELLVFTDGARFASGCRFHLAGKTDIGLFPSLFTLQAWNLREKDYLLLASAKTLEVRRGDSCLASGKVTDVFRRTVPEGTVTTAAFSPGLELWEAPVSLAVEAGASVSDTVRGILAASGTGVPLMAFPGEDPVFSRGQAYCGRTADCLTEALSAAGARGVLVPAGLCVVPAIPLQAALQLTEQDLQDAPMFAAGGKKMILSTKVTGFRPGETMTLEWKGNTYEGLILERMTDADTTMGSWRTQLLVASRNGWQRQESVGTEMLL